MGGIPEDAGAVEPVDLAASEAAFVELLLFVAAICLSELPEIVLAGEVLGIIGLDWPLWNIKKTTTATIITAKTPTTTALKG